MELPPAHRRRLRGLCIALSAAVESTQTTTVADVAAVLRRLDASELLPAPHHTPRQSPEAAYARQVALARESSVLDGAALLRLYEGMLRVEAFETTLDARYRRGLCPGAVHLYLGEEAVATGVCSALRAGDMITSTHRGHGHAVAKAFYSLGADTQGDYASSLFAELFGRESGVSGGRGGSMHLYDQHSTGLLGTNGFVGGGLGLANGAALAARLKGTDGVAVAFFGDGGTSHQSFHESLNLAANLKAPVVFVCENNLYATATPLKTITQNPDIASRGAAYGMRSIAVDGNDVVAVAEAAAAAVEAARRGLGPTLIEARTYRSQGHHTNDPIDGLYRTAEERLNWLKYAPIDRLKATLLELGVCRREGGRAHLEGIRAAVVAEMESAADTAQMAAHPLPATAGRQSWREPVHAPLPVLAAGAPTQSHTWLEAVGQGIAEEFRRNPHTAYFGEGTGERGGSYQHTAGLWAEFGGDRFIDTGISELGFTGACMGLAACGCRAVGDTMTVDFMLEATSTLVEQAGKLRYMSGGATTVPMVMRAQAGNTRNMGPHHSGCYWPMFAHCPGLLVAVPAFARDAKGLMKTALRFTDDPVIFMEPKRCFKQVGEIPTEEEYIPFGVANIVRQGGDDGDITVVACGAPVHTVLAAAVALSASRGLECEVVDLRTIVPLDTDTVIASVSRTGRLLVVDEAFSMCGVGAEVIAAVTAAPGMLAALRSPPTRLHTTASAMPFAMALEMEVQITEGKVESAITALVDNGTPVEQSKPLVSIEQLTAVDLAKAAEVDQLCGTMPLLTPYRVKEVSYWFGVPVTLVRWLRPVGATVVEGEPLALISVEATDLNTNSSVNEEVEVLAPVAGVLSSMLVEEGGVTELGKQIGTLSE
jgi:2-oxoisovalerate dehydrogenase E1 component